MFTVTNRRTIDRPTKSSRNNGLPPLEFRSCRNTSNCLNASSTEWMDLNNSRNTLEIAGICQEETFKVRALWEKTILNLLLFEPAPQ